MGGILHLLRDHPFLLSLLRHGIWLILLCVMFLPLEEIFAVRRPNLRRRSLSGDLGFYFISGFVPHLLLIIPLSLTAYVAYYYVPWRIHVAIDAWPIWLRGVAGFVVADLGFYWGHRWAHKFPFLWRFHSVHHDPEHVYFLISARAHPIDNAFIRLCGFIPLYLLGLGAPGSVKGTLVATLIMLAMTVWGFFIHANLRWRFGPFEWLLATPAFHHWHHTRSELRDRNFASMLPVWDWLFRTWHLPASFPDAYGIDEKLPDSVLGQLLYPILPPGELPEPAAAGAVERPIP